MFVGQPSIHPRHPHEEAEMLAMRAIYNVPAAGHGWCLQLGPILRVLGEMDGVKAHVLDHCRYGPTSQDKMSEGPARETTRILTNLPWAEKLLTHRCNRGQRNVTLLNNRALCAQVYPRPSLTRSGSGDYFKVLALLTNVASMTSFRLSTNLGGTVMA